VVQRQAQTFSEADLAYIRRYFVSLEIVCLGRGEDPDGVRSLIEERRLPAPAYVLEDGSEMVPPEYFDLVDEAGDVENLRDHFCARYLVAAEKQRGSLIEEAEEVWVGYISGVYSVCLRQLSPESIARKNYLTEKVAVLLALPKPAQADWCSDLHKSVTELDQLERPFAPDFDRAGRFGRLPTRDLLIAAAHERYPQIF
jgi:hypothetical protein